MRRLTAATLTATALLLALTGCLAEPPTDTSSTPAPAETSHAAPSSHAPSAAQKLADLDGGARSAGEYQKVLDAWAPRCTEPPEKLAGFTYAAVEDLRQNGVNDETEYSALVHLRDSTPAGVKTKCEDVVAGYLVLRESGKS